jgi:hypothetical protein
MAKARKNRGKLAKWAGCSEYLAMFLPNGTHIYVKNPTFEEIARIRDMIGRGETIICTAIEADGTETTQVLWHPDDPAPLVDLTPKSNALPVTAERPKRLRLSRKIKSYFSARLRR